VNLLQSAKPPAQAEQLALAGGYRFGNCEFQPGARRLWIAGREALLGGRAFDLLHALVSQHERVMSKDELYERVWPGLAVEPNNLQVQIWSLRKLLGRDAIATVPRRGYRFMLQVVSVPPGDASMAPTGPASAAHELAWQVRQHRLVTLVGADMAATHALAQAAAQELAGTLPGGVWQTQASVLAGPCGEVGKTASPSEHLHRLLKRLNRKPAVLVVRACHLAAEGAAPAVAAALEAAPQLHILATGQARLGLKIEHVMNLPARAAIEAQAEGLFAALPRARGPRPRPAPPAAG
jgi:DNA-binding winged helix-turn-helix (wHTH) protein